MLKRLLACLMAFICLLLCAGCASPTSGGSGAQSQQAAASLNRYSRQALNLFDTVSTFTGYAESEQAFQSVTDTLIGELTRLHQLFDVYNDYEGVANIKTINDHAGIAPVEVDGDIIRLLTLSREIYESTGGKVNVGMGSVLLLWHNFREEVTDSPATAALPDAEALREAARHTDLTLVEIDTEKNTVYLPDADMRLDVGAIAKGYSVQRLCEIAPEGFLINIGGNVAATGKNPVTGQPWSVGIQKPDGTSTDYLKIVTLEKGCIVTSGDYERYVTFEGKRYHHIIDAETLAPSTLWRAVSVLCEDSAYGDALSTALFVLSREEGEKLAKSMGAEVMWMDAAGNLYMTEGFAARVKQ